MSHALDVTELLATPDGRDECGPPDATIARCERHDVLYRRDGACLVCEREAGR